MLTCLVASMVLSDGKIDFRKAGETVLSRLETAFIRDTRFHGEVSEAGELSKNDAFAWDMAVTLSAYAAAAKKDRGHYAVGFQRVFNSLEPYGGSVGDGFAYSVWPKLSSPDRFYDDNQWILIALVEGYKATGEQKYLDRAEALYRWLLTAETPELGGGLFWKENGRNEKNTCSNAPMIVGALKLYETTKKPEYLEFGKRIYQWVLRLQDSDGLYLDNINLSGKVDKTKWTYNSALMIRANLALNEATKESQYLEEAKRIGNAAIEYWVDPTTGAIKDESSFAHHIAEAWLDLSRRDRRGPWRGVAEKAIRYAYENTVAPDGLYGLRWDRYEVREGKRILLFQASMARGLWMAANR